MSPDRQISALVLETLSKVLMVAGGFIFFFGDRALREIWHFQFVNAELIGIGGGVALMFLGGAIGLKFRKLPLKARSDEEVRPRSMKDD